MRTSLRLHQMPYISIDLLVYRDPMVSKHRKGGAPHVVSKHKKGGAPHLVSRHKKGGAPRLF